MAVAKILVVDDEPQFERLVLQRFRRKVRAKEYDFVFAQNGIQALEKLEEIKDVDIILTDINMPKMDGLTFLTKVNEKTSNVKAVMVSAYGDMDNIRAAMNRGAFDFVTKPIDFNDLEITINKAVNEIHLLRNAENTKAKLDSLQQELSIAREIQHSFLPKHQDVFTSEDSVELYAIMEPAKEVGGDLFDYFYINKEHLAIIIGDVAGKGMPAALFMAVTRTLMRANGQKTTSVERCLTEVNKLLSEDNPTLMFVTLFYGILNIRTGEFSYCSAGHNPPLLIQKDGRMKYLDDTQHISLGVVPHQQYVAKTITLEHGTCLTLFTDGITEAVNAEGEFFENKRLEDFIQKNYKSSSKKIVENLMQAVHTFDGGTAQSDDITAMVLKRLA